MMTRTCAVLFDFGGTLFDYETVAPGERESIIELARWAGVEAEPESGAPCVSRLVEACVL